MNGLSAGLVALNRAAEKRGIGADYSELAREIRRFREAWRELRERVRGGKISS